MLTVRHIFISRATITEATTARAAGTHPIIEVDEVECVAGRGLRGDRYFDHRPDFKGQITFFAWEVYERMRRELTLPGASPAGFRRNVITEGLNLNALIQQEFEIQGVHFLGAEECRPCYWMNEAFRDPRAEEWLKGNGGLRARILTDGVLRRDTGRVVPCND